MYTYFILIVHTQAKNKQNTDLQSKFPLDTTLLLRPAALEK